MIDLLQGSQDALVAALAPIAAQTGMPAGLQVLVHVPKDTEPPYVVIGAIGSDNASNKGDQVEEISAEIHGVFRGPDRAPLLAMLHAVRVALDDQLLTADGIDFEPPRFTGAEAGTVLADGLTYVGLATFKFHAEPA